MCMEKYLCVVSEVSHKKKKSEPQCSGQHCQVEETQRWSFSLHNTLNSYFWGVTDTVSLLSALSLYLSYPWKDAEPPTLHYQPSS